MVSEHESSSMEVNISPTIANPNPLSSTRFVPINFNHSLSVKLDNKNFLIWKQNIVSAIRGYGLQRFVFSDDEVLVQFLTRENARSGKATKELIEWEQQDQLLLSWLLSSTRAKVKQFKTQLQHTKKGGSTIDEYLAKIKVCVDSFASVGVSLSTKYHVESILDGLPNDYESFVTSVTLRNDDFSVEEIEALLMAHESRVEKNNSSLDSSPSAHVTMVVLDEVETLVVEVASMVVVDSIGITMEETIEVVFVVEETEVPQNLSGRNASPRAYYSFSPQVNGVIPTSEVFSDDNWYPDSRASNHVTPIPANMMKSAEFAGQNQVTQVVLMVGKIRDGLYAFDSSHLALRPTQSLSMSPSVVASSFSSKVCTASLSSTFDLWHRRLGHPSAATIKNVLSKSSSCLPSTVSPSTSHLSPSAPPPILSPTMLPAPTSPISSARPISEMDNIVSTHPHAPNSANTNLALAQVVSNPIATPVQHIVSSIADASVTRTIAKDADNTHPMITRGKSGIVKPKFFIVAVREPSSVAAAFQQDEWKKAMVAEYDALQRNNTWSLVPLPAGRQAIGCKWVYKTKKNPDGTVQKYKARLVAKGFHQQVGFDFTETFSPVVKPSTIRVVFTIALSRNWAIKQLDVNNVFLNGDLQEEVFMQQPQGFIDEQNPNLVCRLHKALYGLKQAPRAWFTPSHITYVLVYVDDILVTGSDTAAITSLIAQLNSEFSLKDLGKVHYFLGIQVSHTNNGLHLSQTKYIRDLLQKTKMVHCKPARTPLPTSLKLRAGDGDLVEDLHGYRSIVGALQYVTITRPELSFSVNKVCQFMQNPTEKHWKAVKRILRYLQGTLQHGLHLKKSSSLDLVGFCDAD
ncbi:Retrovirus-related Pol polyprotein from transposon RE1 [Vitis vinifera]|uniref:Retrovirus-related Pol polyprotein from transposon RE1 n=1 Tax=Vitis vinifera TaxID=29760 RepID=A0A438F280_VITVI|nr:Retrovirus-related Pol polyprotein from transposon RE1 [Vitis vinifera]